MTRFLNIKTLLLLGLLLIKFHGEARLENYSKELANPIQALEKLPEARELIDEVQKQGPIQVVYLDMPGQELEGFWNAALRQIEVNRSAQQSQGRLIGTILFELHNAQTSQKLIQITDLAKRNLITKDEFVSSVEKMEHGNALHASHLLEKGIKLGYYPKDSSWPIFYQFEDHYKLQQVLEHSKWLANHYDQLNKQAPKQEMKGTIPGLKTFTAKDKNDFVKYLTIKNGLESPFEQQRQRAFTAMSKEFSNGTERQWELMQLAFDKNPAFEEVAMGSKTGIAQGEKAR